MVLTCRNALRRHKLNTQPKATRGQVMSARHRSGAAGAILLADGTKRSWTKPCVKLLLLLICFCLMNLLWLKPFGIDFFISCSQLKSVLSRN